MLCYWILRLPGGKPAGTVRLWDDRVTLTLSAPVAGTFTLFSATATVPILPDSETRFPNAEALLGTENGRTTCYAAAQNAAPLACYEKRLSHLYTKLEDPPILPNPPHIDTIEAENEPVFEDNSTDQSQLNTIEMGVPDSISDTAREAETFSLLLNRAEAFYAAYESTADMVHKEDSEARGINLFPQAFPGARWRYVSGTGLLPHYEGTWTQWDGKTVRILAVPGRAAPRPPRTLMGFTSFLRDKTGAGYWVRTETVSRQ